MIRISLPILALLFMLSFFTTSGIVTNKAEAFVCSCNCCDCCLCSPIQHMTSSTAVQVANQRLRMQIFGNVGNPGSAGLWSNVGNGAIGDYQAFLIGDILEDEVFPALRRMTTELTTAGLNHAGIIGKLIDAQTQIDTQRVHASLAAQAHKDYQPSASVCVFGTATKALTMAEENTKLTQSVLSRYQLNRLTNNADSAASQGYHEEKVGLAGSATGRLETFIRNFCNPNDMNRLQSGSSIGGNFTGLGMMCGDLENRDTPILVNKDIDFTGSIMSRRTIDLDFMATELPQSGADSSFPSAIVEEEGKPNAGIEVFQMSSYLFGHEVDNKITAETLSDPSKARQFLDKRSWIAKRSVATNSFNSIVALKTRGSSSEIDGYDGPGYADANYEYIANLLVELGLEDEEIAKYLGTEDGNKAISYFAQMEILAKKIYQRPSFYVDLYDKPENVKRKIVAMQAVGLMLDREIQESHARSEALLAQLLEIRNTRLQKELNTKIDGITGQ